MTESDVRSRWRRLKTLHIVAMLAIAAYGQVAYTIASEPGGAQPVPIALAVALAVVSAAILLVGLPLVRAKMFPPRAAIGDGGASWAATLATEPGQAALRRLRRGLLVAWALCWLVSTYGLILVVLTHRVVWYAPFAGAAVLGVVANAPRDSLARAVAGALGRP